MSSDPGAGLRSRPSWWPHFTSPLRSTAVTARLGRLVGICFLVCFLTGMLSHYQYQPWSWLPEPARPVQAYRVTQGLHVATGVAAIPLLLVKLWSVYPNLFRWPILRSAKNGLERLSVAVLVSSSLVQLTTGLLNTLNWYPWPWSFPATHRFLGYVVIGSILLHIAIKLPDIKYGLQAKLAEADVLSEISWDQNPDAHSNAGVVAPPPMPALDRRGLFVAVGAAVGTIVVTTIGQTVTPLARLGLLATRQASKGPQGVPVNKTARSADVLTLAVDPGWTLEVLGPEPFTLTLAELESMSTEDRSYPLSCVEGWSVGADWRGVPSSTWYDAPAATSPPGRAPLAAAPGHLQPQHDRRPSGVGSAPRDPPQRRAPRHRPRLPAPPDRSQPPRRAPDEVAEPTGDQLMRAARIALGVAGGLLLAFGVFRLVTYLDNADLISLALWLAVAIALHDGVIAPLTVGTGVLLTRVPPRARRYLQGALIVGALITVIAIPLIDRRGTQPAIKAILLRDYAGNLALLLGLTAAVALAAYAARVLRERGPRRSSTPDAAPE